MPRHERVAVVVIRAWLEPVGAHPFRARITTRLDLEAGADQVEAAASIEDVIVRVERWLREFSDSST
jgi:hypothetical protein